MNTRQLKFACAAICLIAALATGAYAQHGGGSPGGPPVGGPGRMGPGPAGPAGAPSAAAHSSREMNQKSAQSPGPVGRWWDDKSTVKSIGISSEQQKKMDSIFNASKPEILARYQDFLKAQSKMESVNKNAKASQEETFAAIDAVNQARAALQKSVAEMYLQVRQQMDSGQIEKLEKIP